MSARHPLTPAASNLTSCKSPKANHRDAGFKIILATLAIVVIMMIVAAFIKNENAALFT